MGYDSYIKIKKSEFSLVKKFFTKENFVFYNFKNEFQICSFHKFIDDQCKYKEGVLFSISKSKKGYVIWGRNWASCTSYDLELHNNTLIRLSQEFKREYVTDEGKNTPFTIYKEPFGLCNALGFPFDGLSNLFEESLFICSKIEPLSETQLQMKKMLGELTIFNQESFSMNLLLIYVVSILENYFKSTFINILKCDKTIYARVKKLVGNKIPYYAKKEFASGKIDMFQELACAFSFQNINNIVETYKNCFGLDLMNVLKNKTRSKKTKFDLLDDVFKKRHLNVHKLEYKSTEMLEYVKIITDVQIILNQIYKYMCRFFDVAKVAPLLTRTNIRNNISVIRTNTKK